MQSNSYHNRQIHGPNAELYQEVFRVLDDLGMADLKLTFQEHCIQVLRSMTVINIMSTAKFLIAVNLSVCHVTDQRAIKWVSSCRYLIFKTFCNWIPK